jgi:hypothetical protein
MPARSALLAAAEAALASERAEGILKGDAFGEWIEASQPAGVAALCGRVLELERGLFEWHQVVQVDGRGETPRCRGCGASPAFTGADPRSMPVHAPDCWVAALLAGGGEDRHN